MIEVGECIVCGNGKLHRKKAEVAPFIAEYVLGQDKAEADLLFCPRCFLFFSSKRFTAEETRRLYAGYRGPDYCAVREKHEPGYSAVNASIGASREELDSRIRFSERLLERVRPLSSFASVMDYGGDRGQLIPGAMSAAKKFVFELSDATPEVGVVAVQDPSSAAPYDLVMCRGVLEHVSNPLDLLRQLKSLVAANGLIYLEMPAGIPARRYFQALFWQSNIGAREGVRLHEHINFFTKTSLANALAVAGLHPEVISIAYLDVGWTKWPVLACVARPAAERDPIRGKAAFLSEAIEYAAKRHLLSPLRLAPG